MNIIKTAALLITIVILFSQTGAATTIRAELNPVVAPGEVEQGQPLVLELYMQNDWGEIIEARFLWRLYSPDESITRIIHRSIDSLAPFPESPGDTGTVYSADSIPFSASYNDSSCLVFNDFGSYWSQYSAWTGFGWDGNLPDTISFVGQSLENWPLDGAETLYLGFALRLNQVGQFCIDSTAFASASPYDWLFLDDPAVSFNGPYCWTVVPSAAVDYEDQDLTPVTFELKQNYPNPFNSQTNIEFSIPQSDHVTLTVYNVLGQEVKTLVDRYLEAGTYSAKWNGDDGGEMPLATGTYFYQLESGAFATTRKMTLIK